MRHSIAHWISSWISIARALKLSSRHDAALCSTRALRWFLLMHRLSREQLDALRGAAQGSERDALMIALAVEHGLRASEVCRLRVQDKTSIPARAPFT
jgi:integrase